MTVPSALSRIDYTGNGATVAFPYPFKIFAAADLVVTLTDADGAEAAQTLNVDYTVSGAGASTGGTVTMTTAPATGYTLTIERSVVATQDTDLRNQGPYLAEVIERALDRVVMLVQQALGWASAGLRLPRGEAPSDTTTILPPLEQRKGHTLGFDPTTGQPGAYAMGGTEVSAAMIPVVQAATVQTGINQLVGAVTADRVLAGDGTNLTLQKVTTNMLEDASITTTKMAPGIITSGGIFEVTEPVSADQSTVNVTITADQASKNLYVSTNTPKWRHLTLPNPATVTGKTFCFVVDGGYGGNILANYSYMPAAVFYGVRIVGQFADYFRAAKILLAGNSLVVKSNGTYYDILHCHDSTNWHGMDLGAAFQHAGGYFSPPNFAQIVRVRRQGSVFSCRSRITQNGAPVSVGSGEYIHNALSQCLNVGGVYYGGNTPVAIGTFSVSNTGVYEGGGEIIAYTNGLVAMLNHNNALVSSTNLPLATSRTYEAHYALDVGGDW